MSIAVMAEPVPILLDYEESGAPQSLSVPRSGSQLREAAARWLDAPDVTGVAIAHLLAGAPDRMMCVASCGPSAPPVGTLLDVNLGISGRCIRENRVLRSYDTRLDPRVDPQACESLGIRSLAIAPLRRDSRCVGILEVFSDQPGAFGDETMAALQRDATLAAACIDFDLHSEEMRAAQGQNGSNPILAEVASSGTQISGCASDPVGTEVEPAHSMADVARALSDAPQFLRAYGQNNRRPFLRWIALLVVSVCVGFSGPKLIRRLHSVETVNSSRVQSSAINKISAVVPAPVPAATPNVPAPMSVAMSKKEEPETGSTSRVHSLAKEAESGDVAAQIQLAYRYAHGDGASRDKVKATAWYIVAGANGDGQAKSAAVQVSHELSQFEIGEVRFNVAKMFRDGIGTSPDPITAYSWFVLSGAAGDVRAKGEEQKLEHTLSPSEVAEARRRAAEWISSHHVRSLPSNKVIAISP